MPRRFYGTDWKKITRRTCEFKDVPFVPSLDRGSERVNFDEFVVDMKSQFNSDMELPPQAKEQWTESLLHKAVQSAGSC